MRDYAVRPYMAKGLGRGDGFYWPGDILERLLEDVEPGAVSPLQAPAANIVRRHPVPPYALVCGQHQSDGDPTLDISARPGEGLQPICCEAAGYPFQGSCRLHTQYPINGGDEGRKVSALLEA